MGFRIKTIHAWLSVDENDEEGIIAASTSDGLMMPLISADETRMYQCEAMARRIAALSGRAVRLVRFSVREDLSTIEPPSSGRD
jgi:hypothetical protein